MFFFFFFWRPGFYLTQAITMDLARTFPNLGMFQEQAPYYSLLKNLLGAYVFFCPEIGYVQGMSFMAAMLLLNMEPYEAFVAFANVMNR